jgi:hypothetical protein
MTELAMCDHTFTRPIELLEVFTWSHVRIASVSLGLSHFGSGTR